MSAYGGMLTTLVADHRASGGPVACYYLDVPLEETLRRHVTKAIAGAGAQAFLASFTMTDADRARRGRRLRATVRWRRSRG